MKLCNRLMMATMMGTAAMIAVPAIAQDQPQANESAGAETGEIIVTAQRQNERLRDVPISITALNDEALNKAGVNNALELQNVTPGLQMVMYGGFLQPAIRGISSAGSGLGDASNVAMYVDGVYQPSQSGQLIDLPDVKQIEVLKGPQGTLYGQNAAGGAIIVTSMTPSLDAWTGKISASYGNYDDKQVKGYVSGPLAEKLAFLVSGGWRDRNGYRKDIARGGRGLGLQSEVVRGKLLFEASDVLSFTASGYYSRRVDGDGYAGQPYSGPGAGTALGYALGIANGVTFPQAQAKDETATSVLTRVKAKAYGFNLKTELNTDSIALTLVNAYGNVQVRNIADVDYTAANLGDVDLRIDQHNWLHELNFRSIGNGPLEMSAGLFYMNNTEAYVPQIFFLRYTSGAPFTAYPTLPSPLAVIGYHGESKKRSLAAYAELTWKPTDRITITAGGRYAYERQKTAYVPFPQTQLVPDPRGGFDFRRFTPRVTARYALNDRSNVYATYSQGFKSGFVNPSDTVTPPVKPEVVKGYEIGFKGRIADALNLNLSAFHYDYTNLQVFVYIPPNGIYQNAASARINGVEFEASLAPVAGLTLSASGTYLDGKYKSYPGAGVYLPAPRPTPGFPSFGNIFASVDASGNRLVRTPRFTGNLSVDYATRLSAGELGLHASAVYNSGLTYSPDERLRQPSYGTVSGEISFAPASVEGLRLVAYGKNLTNKLYIQSILSSQFVDGVSYSEPRTYGIRAEFSF